ncbi:MAG: hypothetical protein XD95_0602 [Microgenomates bacterium 39_7]|nr:MAG: hypothetical protein XD95_0602 [Microgenomates bacterium 39_7]
MNKETIARLIIAVGYTLAKKYPPSSVQMVEGGSDNQQYSYSGSYALDRFQLQESPGGERVEVKSDSDKDFFIVSYSGQELAKITINGSSGNAQDLYNNRSYYSLNFSSNRIVMDGITFLVS